MPEPEHSCQGARTLMWLAPRVAHAQREALRQLRPSLGITQYGVLARLGHGATSMTVLRERSVVTFSTLSEATSALVCLGLVERFRSEEDRRHVELKLTERGQETLNFAKQILNELRLQLTDGLPQPGKDELEEFWQPLDQNARRILAEHSKNRARGGEDCDQG